MFESITDWASRNKAGIIISAASIGLLFMTFKKLLSVSPMLQKMIEIMNLAFNLVLRPFRDFIVFILRPIAMMMLTSVMPFFKAAYPFLMKLGGAMGDEFAKFVKTGNPIHILQGLGLMFEAISPSDVLAWVFGAATGDTSLTEDNTGGMVGAVGAGIGGGAVLGTAGAFYGGYRATKWGVGKIFGNIGGGTGESGWQGKDKTSKNPMGGNDGKTGKGKNIFKNIKGGVATALSKAAAAKHALLTAKAAIQASSKAMLAFKISNPIGWAMLGWDGVTTAIKHFDPELYQQMRNSTEFMGIGREFIGLGEQSSGEMLYGGYEWAKNGLGIGNSISDPNATFPDNGLNQSGFSGISTQTANGGTHITFNIDKVEKGVDVNMIALQVKAILETNDRFVTN